MKKINKFLIAIIMLLVLGLVGCDAFTSLPTDEYSKVKFAFNGVEESIKSAAKRTALSSDNDGMTYMYSPSDDALNRLFSLYGDGEKTDEVVDLSYNEPPFVQFQYIKTVLEKIGSSYQFSNKYYDDITGEIYVDLENGKKIEKDSPDKDNYKCNYTFRMSLNVSINENDFITADVSFNIKLVQNGKEYNTTWYVLFLLDYDMTNKKPSYELGMYVYNDEVALSYSKGYTYEYDYVLVDNNEVKEWRKFDLESPILLVKDDSHQNIDAYYSELSESDKFFVGNCKWWKNNQLNKFTTMDDNRKKIVADILFSGIGLNYSDINASEFLSREGTKASAISTTYKNISKIYGDDIIYNLVCREDDSDKNQGFDKPTKAMFFGNEQGEEVNTFEILDTLSGYDFLYSDQNKDGKVVNHPVFYKMDRNGNTKVDDLSGYEFLFYGFDFTDNTQIGIAQPNVVLDYQGFITSEMNNIIEIAGGGIAVYMVVMKDNCYADAIIYGSNGGISIGDKEELRIYNETYTETITTGLIVKECTIGELFTSNDAWKAGKPVVVTCDGEGKILRTVSIDEMAFSFSYNGSGSFVDKDRSVSDIYESLGKPKSFTIEIKVGNMSVILNDVTIDVESGGAANGWNQDLIDSFTGGKFKLPMPVANNAYYEYNQNINSVKILGLTEEEIINYINVLNTLGHVNSAPGYYNGYKFIYENIIYTIPFYSVNGGVAFEFNFNGVNYNVMDYSMKIDGNRTYKFNLREDLEGYELSVFLKANEEIQITSSLESIQMIDVEGIMQTEPGCGIAMESKDFYFFIHVADKMVRGQYN